MKSERIETKAVKKRGGRSALLLPVLALGGGYLLWNSSFAESSSGLLWLLLLACPLMHFLMPHGHGGAHGSGDQGETETDSPSELPGPSSTRPN